MSQIDAQALVEQLLQELQDVLARLGVKDHAHYDAITKRTLLDAAITVLPPNTLSEAGINRLNQLLQSELSKAGIHHTLAIKQLYHDREEVTVCLITATPEPPG